MRFRLLYTAMILFSLFGNERLSAQSDLDSLITRGEQLMLTDNDSALFFFSKALMKAQGTNQLEKEIKCTALLGDLYSGTSDFPKAISFYVTAIKKAETNDREDLAAKSYNGLGVVAYQRGDLKKAEKYFLHAADLKLKAGQLEHYAMIMTNISGVLFSMEKFPEALENLKKVLPEVRNNEAVLAAAYNSIGGIYQQGYQRLDSAEYYYRKSIALGEKGGYHDVLISAYHNLGEIFLNEKKFQEGISMLQKALATSRKLKKDAYSITVLNALSEAYENIGQLNEALKAKKEAFQLSQTLNTSENREAIERLQVQFEAEKKSAELAKKNQALAQSELKIAVLKSRYIIIAAIGFILLVLLASVYFYFTQKRKSEQRIQEEKNKLFVNIVHEIRTPLTLIHGPLKLIKDHGDIAQLQKQLPLIERNSDRLLRMVNDLLSLSKMDKGEFSPAIELGNPMEFIARVANTFQGVMEQRGQSLELSLSEGEVVQFHSEVLETTLLNLLSNANKYAGSDAHVIIEAKLIENKLDMKVHDSGKGVATVDEAFVFNRYYRGKGAEQAIGNGLGLALVSELLEKINGEISYSRSHLGGACFHVTIPLEMSSVTLQTSTSEQLPLLLLVEDDYDLAAFVQSVFQDELQVLTAYTLKEAIEQVKQTIPDIVLTDLMLPDGSGNDLVVSLKENALTSHIPVAVFSARAADEVKKEVLQNGAYAYFTKPFDPLTLKLSLINILNDQKQSRKTIQGALKGDEQAEPIQDTFLLNIISIIHNHLDDSELGPDKLGELIGLSRSQLHRKLTSLSGQSTSNFIRIVRLKKAKDFLAEKKYSVKEVAFMCGFNSPTYFSKSFKDFFGQSPAETLEKG